LKVLLDCIFYTRILYYVTIEIQREVSPENSTPCICLHGVDTYFVFTVYASYVFFVEILVVYPYVLKVRYKVCIYKISQIFVKNL